ncbi:MAG: SPOR domain-containing protein [Gemmatimonadaceae bacterium]|nr:SPOR domain-containing protein [Gemmatimonadaceae bacterium]
MRTLLALALVLAACGRSDRPADPAAHDASPSLTRASGPDPVVLRIPRGGGAARAYLYPHLDSAVWSSPAPLPAPERTLAFDDEAGQLLVADAKGAPVRLDLRTGDVTITRKPKLLTVASVDGQSVYGVTDSGTVVRFTPSGRWSFKAPLRAREVLPQSDGSLLVEADRAGNAVLWHLWPPDSRIVDSAVVPAAARARSVQAGDRVVLVRDSSIASVRGRDLSPSAAVSLSDGIRALAATPSGDRLYVLTAGKPELRALDRYREGDGERIELPGEAIDLRMDPLGRYLLVRPAKGDSAWVVALGAQRVLGAVATTWRADLPALASDGRLALVSGNDVRFVDPETFAPGATVRGGARDFWAFVAWNGFRPRDASLDQPVRFDSGVAPRADSTAHSDSGNPFPSPAEVAGVADARAGSVPLPNGGRPAPGGAPPQAASAPASRGYFVSVASHNNEAAARDDAAKVTVEGVAAHVATAPANGGGVVYRVVLGPYGSRAAAGQAGSRTKRPYWIYEAGP